MTLENDSGEFILVMPTAELSMTSRERNDDRENYGNKLWSNTCCEKEYMYAVVESEGEYEQL